MELDFDGLNSYLLTQIRNILPEWLPGGNLNGQEYSCGDLRGGQGRSCKVNVQTGRWADFSSTDKGGDLVSLYAAIHGVTQAEAFKTLSEQYNYKQTTPNVPRATSEPASILPPDTVIIPDFRHHKYGLPIQTWDYRTETNQLMFYVARYDSSDGKQFIPWTWSGAHWVPKSWNAPRPLYGLETLVPGKPILLVEGEKAALAARAIAHPHYVVLTWSGGSKAFTKTDFSPIYGRNILLWPDADKPGMDAMTKIAELLKPHAKEIKILDVSGESESSDAADYGFTWDEFKQWAKPRAQIINITVNQHITVDEEPQSKPSESAYATWQRLGIILSSTGHPITNEDNVMRVFEGESHLGKLIYFDDFYNSVFIDDREIKDLDIFKLQTMLQRNYGFQRVTDATVRRALVVLADRTHRNEPRDWMESLVWDGIPRIENFLITHLGAKQTPYTQAASKNFWISMVARIYNPGCIMRTMVILKSKQWAGKSTAFSLIGGKWYAEALESIQSNNFLQSLHGKMLIEFADMSGMDRADVNRIKQIISCRMDRFRAPYDRTPNDHMRRCVLVSTTNEGNFLRDDTGGSRFWPIETGTIDQSSIIRDRSNLFAEAVHCFKAGQDWYHMPTDETEAVQEAYRQNDIWEEVIAEYLNSPSLFKKETTVKNIFTDCLKLSMDKWDKSTQIRIARNLATLGYEKFQKFENGANVKVWRLPLSNTEVDID